MAATRAILADLTPAQREAVTHTEGPLLVVAGAGSGKTRVVTRRVAYLVAQGAEPYRVLAVTFTNKAAGEMRERIARLAGTRGAWVSTFHSLCASMLRISADQAGLARDFSIYDRTDQLNAVKEAMKRLELGTELLRPSAALHAISTAKAELRPPDALASEAASYRDELVARIYAAYQQTLEANAALDFDDLLMRVATLLADDQAFRERWQRRFHYVVVDEYQDTNRAQYLIARELAAAHRNLCVTGDPDQSIYGWRGADIRNILDFQRDYLDAHVVKLERNYRSTRAILRAANALIVHNALRHERDMWTDNEDGAPLRFRLAADAEDEALAVVAEIQALRSEGAEPRDVAVFYRTNAQSRSFEEAFVAASVPYRVVGAVEFYGRQEIKDLLAYLRACANERDELSLLRIINTPSRGIGDRTVARLQAWAEARGVPLGRAVAEAEQIPQLGTRGQKAVDAFARLLAGLRAAPRRPVAEYIQRVLDQSGLRGWLDEPENEERRENVQEFLAKAAAYDQESPEGDLSGFLQEVSLVSDVDNLDRSANAASLMTLHAAKGLEFPIVFVTGLEEGLLPHANSSHSEAEVEEERRLCYVGMTRAQKRLVLTAACERAQYNAPSMREPSRFLAELPTEAFDEASRSHLAGTGAGEDLFAPQDRPAGANTATDETDWRARVYAPSPRPASKARRPRTDLSVGDWVRHEEHGEGRIVGLQRSEKMTLATVAMRGGGKRLYALEHAPLRKL